REIHDTVLQAMVGVALQIHGMSKTVDSSQVVLRKKLERAGKQLEFYIREARLSIWDLRSAALDRRTLAETLREFGEDLTAETAIELEVAVTGKPRICSARIEKNLLRIGQEAIT